MFSANVELFRTQIENARARATPKVPLHSQDTLRNDCTTKLSPRTITQNHVRQWHHVPSTEVWSPEIPANWKRVGHKALQNTRLIPAKVCHFERRATSIALLHTILCRKSFSTDVVSRDGAADENATRSMWNTLTSNRVDARRRRAKQSGERQRTDVQLCECSPGTRNGTNDAHCRRRLSFPIVRQFTRTWRKPSQRKPLSDGRATCIHACRQTVHSGRGQQTHPNRSLIARCILAFLTSQNHLHWQTPP